MRPAYISSLLPEDRYIFLYSTAWYSSTFGGLLDDGACRRVVIGSLDGPQLHQNIQNANLLLYNLTNSDQDEKMRDMKLQGALLLSLNLNAKNLSCETLWIEIVVR